MLLHLPFAQPTFELLLWLEIGVKTSNIKMMILFDTCFAGAWQWSILNIVYKVHPNLKAVCSTGHIGANRLLLYPQEGADAPDRCLGQMRWCLGRLPATTAQAASPVSQTQSRDLFFSRGFLFVFYHLIGWLSGIGAQVEKSTTTLYKIVTRHSWDNRQSWGGFNSCDCSRLLSRPSRLESGST